MPSMGLTLLERVGSVGSPVHQGKMAGKTMDARPAVLNSLRAVSFMPGQAVTGASAPLSLARLACPRSAASTARSSSMLFPAGTMKESVSSGVSPSSP